MATCLHLPLVFSILLYLASVIPKQNTLKLWQLSTPNPQKRGEEGKGRLVEEKGHPSSVCTSRCGLLSETGLEAPVQWWRAFQSFEWHKRPAVARMPQIRHHFLPNCWAQYINQISLIHRVLRAELLKKEMLMMSFLNFKVLLKHKIFRPVQMGKQKKI